MSKIVPPFFTAAALVGCLAATPGVAADLPIGPPATYGPAPRAYAPYPPAPAFFGSVPARPRPYFAEASRFDIYGYPVALAAPDPLYASTGCPPLIGPVYDAVGNFAGYAPVQGCR